MKKIVVFLFMFLWVGSLQAQTAQDRYKIEWSCFWANSSTTLFWDCTLDVEIIFTDGHRYYYNWAYYSGGYGVHLEPFSYYTSREVESVILNYRYVDHESLEVNHEGADVKIYVASDYDYFNTSCINIKDDVFSFIHPLADAFTFTVSPINMEVTEDSQNQI